MLKSMGPTHMKFQEETEVKIMMIRMSNYIISIFLLSEQKTTNGSSQAPYCMGLMKYIISIFFCLSHFLVKETFCTKKWHRILHFSQMKWQPGEEYLIWTLLENHEFWDGQETKPFLGICN